MNAPAASLDAASPRRAAVSPFWFAGAAISLLTAFVFMAFPLGVGGDYLNQLARAYIEGFIGASETLRGYYEVTFAPIPDLAMDLTVPWLSHLIGVYPAGAATIVLAALLGPIAGLYLSRRLHREDGRWLPFVGFLTIFSLPLEIGFVNFLIGAGLALWAFVLWTQMAPGWRRAAVFAVLGGPLVLAHALGFLLLGFMTLLWELGAWRAGARGDAKRFATGLLTMGALAFGPGLALLAVSMTGGVGEISPPNTGFVLGQRDVALTAAFRFHNDPLAIAAMILSCAFVLVGLYVSFRWKIVSIRTEMAYVCGGLALLVLLAPVQILGIWGLHFRFAGALIILLAAAMKVEAGGRGVALAGGVFAAVLALQVGAGFANVVRMDMRAGAVRDALAALPDGARLLTVSDPAFDIRLGDHAGGLAVIEADAYVPTLFTNTSPVGVTPAMRALHMPQANPLDLAALHDAVARATPPAANGHWSKTFYYGWPRNFTHVLYFREEGAPSPNLSCLEPLATTAEFAVFVVAPGLDGACPPARGEAT